MLDDDSVVRRWLRKGASGWRLDVVDELPDEFLKKLRRVVKEENPDYVIIGEVWEDASNKFSYGKMREFLWGEELDSAMNYPFRKLLLSFILGESDADTLNNGLMSLYENYPLESFYSMMNLIGSHDVTRVITLLEEAPSEDRLSKEEQASYKPSITQRRFSCKSLMLLALLQMTFPGVPCIYYGDEIGLEGHRDPFNRRPYPWWHEDKELLGYYKRLGALRKDNPVLKSGQWHAFYHEGDVYAFCRSICEEHDVFEKECRDGFSLTVINRSLNTAHGIVIDISPYCSETVLCDVMNGGREVKTSDGMLRLDVAPLTGILLMTE
jgi:4-alpha-glucanotransferase